MENRCWESECENELLKLQGLYIAAGLFDRLHMIPILYILEAVP